VTDRAEGEPAGRTSPAGTARTAFQTATDLTGRGRGRYGAVLDPRFSFGDKINGGYLLAIAACAASREMASTAGPAGPQAASSAMAQYLHPPRPGPAELAVTVLRRGRTSSQVRGQATQASQTLLEALITLRASPAQRVGDGAATEAASAPGWTDEVAPFLPPEGDCFLMPTRPPGAPVDVPLMGMVEQRLDPECLGFAFGVPTDTGQLRGWVRIPGHDQTDVPGLLLIADALPPAVFDLGYVGWVPTLSLTAHVLGSPAPGPLRVRQQVRGLGDGLVTQTCDIWDTDDKLVVHASQLAVVPDQSRPTATARPTTVHAG
jgi:acyl-coenzyme A thioesterase PaaI-like protein